MTCSRKVLIWVTLLDIFANLAAQVKLYDDICDKNDNGAMVTTWDHIRVFWNEMSSVRQYKHVDRGVFKEKYRRQLKSKKRNQPAQQIAEVLCFDEEAPPKTSANTTRYWTSISAYIHNLVFPRGVHWDGKIYWASATF